MVQETHGKHDIELTKRFASDVQHIQVVMLDVTHAVDVLRQAKTRVVFVPKIERLDPCPTLTRLETEIAIRGAYIGIAGKDLSTVNIDGGQIVDTRVGIAVFQKKSEFGAAKVTVTNLDFEQAPTPFLVETGSRLLVDGTAVAFTGDSVSVSLYPNESGDD